MLFKWIPLPAPRGVFVLDVVDCWWPTLRLDCRLKTNQKLCLSSPSKTENSRGENKYGSDGVDWLGVTDVC